MQWDIKTQEKLNAFISRIPVFHRHITEQAVTKKAVELAQSRGASMIEEVDVVSAFFSDVPSPFYSMMVRLLEQAGGHGENSPKRLAAHRRHRQD